MKKMQSLGKALTKTEQRNVIGGLAVKYKLECGCDDNLLHWSYCETTCALAATTCFAACAPYGNTEPVAILTTTCTTC
jgi:hypothetical protein